MNNYLTYARNLLVKENRPLSLVYFITDRCNLRCRHCFFSENINKQSRELEIGQIESLSKSTGKFLSLSLTGGEPFLREDIAEIARIFYKNSSIRNLNIPTNGLLGRRVIEKTRQILSACPDLALNLAVSLDGPAQVHDSIRNCPGGFTRALETFKDAQELRRDFARLSLEILTVLSADNQHVLDGFYDFALNELRPDSLNLSPIRGNVPESALADYDVDIYEKNIKRLQRAFLSQRISGYANFPFSEYAFAIRMVMPRIVLRILRQKAYQTECYAGRLSGVIYSNGDVYPCELLNMKMGNLKDYGFDLIRLWRSRQARDVRRYIKESRCFCIHPCNFTVNILFNLRYLPRLAWYGLRLKLARISKRLEWKPRCFL